ncbi:MAG: sulfatase-like hydrolase/transferase [Verrucomicrobiales bacterium]
MIIRRDFLKSLAASTIAVPVLSGEEDATPRPDYKGPNVIIVRFGGGVRRRETIDPAHTYAPFVCKELARRGTLYKRMEISQFANINTSHGEGTLYILTGKYEKYRDITGRFLGGRFESKVPTLFEYLRGAFNVPEHQALIINGEDRTDEEFYSFSNHHLFGAEFRSDVLSLYRFKVYLLRQQISSGHLAGKELATKQKQLAELEQKDRRLRQDRQSRELDDFWQRWRHHYGDTGFRNPRGDRLLTELTLRALKELRPRLLMVNFNDPDYVHWGYLQHYTTGIAVIDDGVKQLVAAVEADPEYQDNTIFVIVPDCGRDSNPFSPVPCQHHMNSKSSHEIWALLLGPGIAKGAVVDKLADQSQIAATVGKMMGFQTRFTEGPILEDVFA